MEQAQLSSAEAELYDRQIRLWGIESQQKLRAANVLLIGVRALGSEIAKNILLSGINSLTILDDGVVTKADVQTNFLLNHSSTIGNNIAEEALFKAQALNPLVKITADPSPVTEKNANFYSHFTIVVATGISFDSIIKIDGICRENKVKFLYGDVFGMTGFSVADFQEHDYYEDRVQLPKNRKRGHSGDQEKVTVKIQGKLTYPPLNKVLILPNTKQDSSCIKKSRPNKLLVCLLALIQFKKKNNRNPEFDRKGDDIKQLKDICGDVMELYNYKDLNLDNLFDLIFGEVAPVCSVVGGVMAQEVIKAVSHKEATINNIFVFDPITFSGKELVIGA